MRSLSAMVKDTKRYCRIQIGYLLKKLCKRFTAEDLIKFVPGDDEVTHRRLKKIRKQLRRETRKAQQKEKTAENEDSDDEFIAGLEKKSMTIDDILANSDSDLPDEMDVDSDGDIDKVKRKGKKSKTYIREDPEDIVDLADIKSIGNVLTNRPNQVKERSDKKVNIKDKNRGFKTGPDGRLIIDDKALRGVSGSDEESSGEEGTDDGSKKQVKLGMEDDSSDEEENTQIIRKRKGSSAISVRSGKTGVSHYTTGGKGIHRKLDGNDAVSMKSVYTAKSNKSVAHGSSVYATKKAKGDMKKKGQLDPYAYLPLNRNTLNKRKRAKITGSFRNIVNGARKGALKGVKNRLKKTYKK